MATNSANMPVGNSEFMLLAAALIGAVFAPLITKRSTVLRSLVIINHSMMASYSQAINAYLEGAVPRPDLAPYEKAGQENYGFGFNGEQEITGRLRAYGRYGWNQGTKEEAQFAEADRTLTFGGDLDGRTWHREGHRAGLALSINSLNSRTRALPATGGAPVTAGRRRFEITGTKPPWRVTTMCRWIFTESTEHSICSASGIPATIATGARWCCLGSGCISKAKCI